MSLKIDNFCLIIGAMKSGTTTLFSYLNEHPEIARSYPKEPNFFASDENFAKGITWYENLWDFNPEIHKLALEGSTNYTKVPRFPNAAERIATIEGARFKFIYIMRDPIKRIESHYAHVISSKTTKDNYTYTPGSIEIRPSMINTSRYAMQIEQYYQHFPKDSILLLDFEDLKNNLQPLMHEVCDFLEINPEFNYSSVKPVNQSKGKTIDGPLWKYVAPAAQHLPQTPKKIVRKLCSQSLSVKERLTDGQKEFILRELRDDLLKLNQEFGFDTSKWGISV